VSIFAVFDGHNGIDCVRFVCENLVNKIRVNLLNSENALDTQENFYSYIKKVLVGSIQEVDLQYFNKYGNYSFDCGCTAVVGTFSLFKK
jgi:serine/threonine protein phosphatase PrpC